MARQIRVTRRRRQWAESREAVVKGDPLTYPAAAEERYRKSLEALIDPMKRAYERELATLLRELPAEDSALTMDDNLGAEARKMLNSLSRIWQARFNSAASKLTSRMLSQVDRQSKANLGKSLKQLSGGLGIKTPAMPEAMREVISASIAENVDLIKSISIQYHQRISSTVLSAIQTGGLGQKQIFDQVRHIGGMTDRRAKLIARDQVSKVTTQYNAERIKSVGVKRFQWVHSGGGVDQRKRHLELNGQIFEYDNPPIIDERTGERGLPGQLINCRCIAVPVLDFSGE